MAFIKSAPKSLPTILKDLHFSWVRSYGSPNSPQTCFMTLIQVTLILRWPNQNASSLLNCAMACALWSRTCNRFPPCAHHRSSEKNAQLPGAYGEGRPSTKFCWVPNHTVQSTTLFCHLSQFFLQLGVTPMGRGRGGSRDAELTACPPLSKCDCQLH